MRTARRGFVRPSCTYTYVTSRGVQWILLPAGIRAHVHLLEPRLVYAAHETEAADSGRRPCEWATVLWFAAPYFSLRSSECFELLVAPPTGVGIYRPREKRREAEETSAIAPATIGWFARENAPTNGRDRKRERERERERASTKPNTETTTGEILGVPLTIGL